MLTVTSISDSAGIPLTPLFDGAPSLRARPTSNLQEQIIYETFIKTLKLGFKLEYLLLCREQDQDISKHN